VEKVDQSILEIVMHQFHDSSVFFGVPCVLLLFNVVMLSSQSN